MEPSAELKALQDEIYRRKILVARKMTPVERVSACFELTEFVRTIMASGVRDQFPQVDEEEVERILRQRVALGKKLHERR